MIHPELTAQLIDRLKSELRLPHGTSSSGELVAVMAAMFPWEYGADKGVREGYTLQQHTLMVLGQYDTYFGWKDLPQGTDRGLFRLLLALHDIGTPHAIYETGDKRNQHRYTVEMMQRVLEVVGYAQLDVALALAIVSGDPIGRYLKGRETASATCEELVRLVGPTGRGPAEFLDILLTYYQVDAGAYTTDADGIRALDFLFDFDRKNGVMRFSVPIEAKIGYLTAYARELPCGQWLTDHEWHDVSFCRLKSWLKRDMTRLESGVVSDHTFSYRIDPHKDAYQVRLSASLQEALYSPYTIPLHAHGWHTIPEQELPQRVQEVSSELQRGKVVRGRLLRYRRNRRKGTYEIRLTRRVSDAVYYPWMGDGEGPG